MQDHFLPRFGLRNLIVLLTYKTYHLIDILRLGHLLRLEKVKNQMSHTFTSLDLEYGPIFLLKRGNP